jgi:cellulose synthase/poly-beta-1,6-N-acetylglucosamine synthase-like glycosyltransferase
MALVVSILKIYFIFTIVVMIIYAIRHLVFSVNRMFGRQKISYRDLMDSELPIVSVLVPMYNEEPVLENIMQSLLDCDYDRDKLEIIAIDDNSQDRTPDMLDEYHRLYPFVLPLHRKAEDHRGKPAALNDALAIARGEIVIVFDADYRPSKNLIKKLAMGFADPQVGAVMGRVIPENASANLLTNLLNLERTGGYQVDQQARYNMNLLPQYGGTVGGFRRRLIMESGGFDERILAEDTELTYRFYLDGWRILYDNSAECYEESPETWQVRGRQIRRWSRGHNAVLFRYLLKTLLGSRLRFLTRLDAILLLLIYVVPVIFGLGFLDCLALFFLGEMNILSGWWVLLFIGAYNAWGNFSPFYQIAAGALLDGMTKPLMALPLMCFGFYFYLWNINLGFIEAVLDIFPFRRVKWAKTGRRGATEGGKTVGL